jgi:apolipoprotein N-acyltransferase
MEKTKRIYLIGLSILSGVLLWLAWPPLKMNFVIFFALVPILFVQHLIQKENSRFSSAILFYNTFIAFSVWNLLSTYWVYHASFIGAVMAVLINALLMSLPFLLFHKLRNVSKRDPSILVLVVFWMGYEYLHLNWDLAWPWLTLGNAFATHPDWVQWYEYTGVFGGTLWIWLANLFLFSVLKRAFDQNKNALNSMRLYIRLGQFLLIVLLPMLISVLIPKTKDVYLDKNVVIVQPNIDPYHDKFKSGYFRKQLDVLLELSEQEIDSQTRLLVWPETALSIPFDESRLNYNGHIRRIRELLSKHPNLKLITGMDAYRFFREDEKLSATARLYPYDSSYYDSYNAALLLDKSQAYEIYHKSRLVPGVEKMPYPKLFKFLEKMAVDLGGTSGSLGMQEEASVFVIDSMIKAAPIICYESIFGEYVGEFITKGANLIVVITNDGWWKNTSGHRQHYLYARLRAIEYRKNIARSANTGISCYINSNGKILHQTSWWEKDVFKQPISIGGKLTFYARMGDYLGRIAAFISVLFILLTIVRSQTRKNVMEM